MLHTLSGCTGGRRLGWGAGMMYEEARRLRGVERGGEIFGVERVFLFNSYCAVFRTDDDDHFLESQVNY